MANFTQTTTPYEFLVRFNSDGNIAGAHVGFIENTFKDGALISALPLNVQPVAIGIEEGFPLSEIINTIQSQALIDLDVANAKIKKLEEMVKALSVEPLAVSDNQPGVLVINQVQMRKALIIKGYINKIDSIIASLPSPNREIVSVEFDYAEKIHSDNKIVVEMLSQLGLTPEDQLNLFNYAMTL